MQAERAFACGLAPMRRVGCTDEPCSPFHEQIPQRWRRFLHRAGASSQQEKVQGSERLAASLTPIQQGKTWSTPPASSESMRLRQSTHPVSIPMEPSAARRSSHLPDLPAQTMAKRRLRGSRSGKCLPMLMQGGRVTTGGEGTKWGFIWRLTAAAPRQTPQARRQGSPKLWRHSSARPPIDSAPPRSRPLHPPPPSIPPSWGL